MATFKTGDIRKLYGPYLRPRKRPYRYTDPEYLMETSNIYFMETPDGDAEYVCPGDCEGGDECTSSVPAVFEGREWRFLSGTTIVTQPGDELPHYVRMSGIVMRPPEDFSEYRCAGTRHPNDTTSFPYKGKRKFTIITETMAYGVRLS